MPVWIHDGAKWVEVGQPSVQTGAAVRPVKTIWRNMTVGNSQQRIWERSAVGYLPPRVTMTAIPRTRNAFEINVAMPEFGQLRPRRVVVKVKAAHPTLTPLGTTDTLRRNPVFPNAAHGLAPGALKDENEWSEWFSGEQYRDLRGDIRYNVNQTKYTSHSVNRPNEKGVYGELPLGVHIYVHAWIQYSDGTWSEPHTRFIVSRGAMQDPFGIQTFQTVVEPISTDNYAALYDNWTWQNLSQGGVNRDYGMLFYGDRLRQVFREADKSGVTQYDRRVLGMSLRLVRWGQPGFGANDNRLSIGVSRNGTVTDAMNGVNTPPSMRVGPRGPEVYQRWSFAPYYETPATGVGQSQDVALPPDIRAHFFDGTGGGARSLALGDGYAGRPADLTPNDRSRAYYRAQPTVKGNPNSTGYITVTWQGYSNPWTRSTPGATNFKPMQGESSN